jgi:hypothetical protein
LLSLTTGKVCFKTLAPKRAADLHPEPEIFGKTFAVEQKAFGKSGGAKTVEAGGGKYQGP